MLFAHENGIPNWRDIFHNWGSKKVFVVIKSIANAKTKRALLVIVTMLLVLGSFALISIKGTSDIISENQEIEE